MRPIVATYVVWVVWAISWTLAAAWSKRTAATAPRGDRLAYRLVIDAGFIALLLFEPGVPGPVGRLPGLFMLWPVSPVMGWVMVLACVLGFAFAWWARILLGANWSSAVTRKEDHQIIEAGPYRLVRHPIYTGLLVASYAIAIERATPWAILGAALITVGYWMKGRLEERFLSAELGLEAYAAYRRRTPMLIPFWPIRG